ncbi:hypothetical protein N431DRAFT_464559 [Stipitochalara longipes BDJ]|nr:hypothetical protein N431DRAFT_464559 [Stipitochalara longipes BDJ]
MASNSSNSGSLTNSDVHLSRDYHNQDHIPEHSLIEDIHHESLNTTVRTNASGEELGLAPRSSRSSRDSLLSSVKRSGRKYASSHESIDTWATAIGGKEGENFTAHFFQKEIYSYKSNPHSTPAIMHTSHGARFVGTKHYTLSFGSNLTGAIGAATIQITRAPRVWINWDWDIVFPMKTLEGID